MWATAKVAGLALAIVMALLPFNNILGEIASEPVEQPTDLYLLTTQDPDSILQIRNNDIEVVVDYNNGYYIVRGGLSDIEGVRMMGIDVQTIPDRNVLRFAMAGYTFNTGTDPFSLPSYLTSVDTDERIVQFIGPIKSEWVNTVEELGVRLERYVESYAFIGRMSGDQVETIRSLPFVDWIGIYEPAYKIQSELLSMEGVVPVSVIAHEGIDEMRLRSLLEGLGAEVTMTWMMPVTAEAKIDVSRLPALAASPEILEIYWSPEKEPADWASGEIHHFHDAWMVLQSGIPWNLTGHSPGPDGIQGNADDVFEIVGIQDTGFDKNNADDGWPDLFDGPLGDRIVALRRRTGQCSQPDGRFDGFGHGTVVVGTVLSNGYCWELEYGESVDDFEWDKSEAGVVPEGKLSFDCVGAGGGISASPTYWDDEYNDGAKTFSNSYGNRNLVYDATATAADFRTNASNDKMFIFATLNNGPYPNTVSGMSKGKNGFSIGAVQNYRPDRSESNTPNLMATFSSRGNPGERFKPDLVTVGTSVVTGLGFGEWFGIGQTPRSDYVKYVDQYDYRVAGVGQDGIPDYKYYSGTSVATPNAAGLYMLTREYFREMHGIDNVNSQLAKAMLINGAIRMNEDLYEYPGIDQGWGRMDLEQSLFPPAPRTNQWEEGSFSTTGIWTPATINTNIMSSEVPLKVTLVWVDEPSESLVRNLDLLVRDPTGTIEYHGNQYAMTGPLRGWTDPNDADFDSINNVEQVEVQSPSSGKWIVEVRGVSIPSSTNFAIVFSADVGSMRDYQVSLSTDYVTALDLALNGTTIFPFEVTNFGFNQDTISVSHDAPTQLAVSFDWTSRPFTPLEVDTNFATFTASSNASAGSSDILICGTSQNDSNVPPASDCITVKISVTNSSLPLRWDVTSDEDEELNPSILTFSRNGLNHVFIAYMKIMPIDYPDISRGGTNVWMAHNTMDTNHIVNATWTHTSVSDYNDNPVNLRMLYIDNGTFAGRVVITWSGFDMSEPVPEQRPWGRIAYSDPPYSNWTLRTIQKNYGSLTFNRVRASFPVFRETGGSNGTLAWVWEHLDAISTEAPNIAAVQTHITFSWDGGDTWTDCYASSSQCYEVAPGASTDFYFFPNGIVDQNDVLWTFFYWRSPTAGQNRNLAVVLWDGFTWDTGWTSPINIWDLGGWNNIEHPFAVSTPEGGNRVYVAVTVDNGTVWTKRIYVTYAEGTFGSGLIGPPPTPAVLNNISVDFSPAQGPMGDSALTTRYSDGPVFNIVYTDDGIVWVPYEEEKELLGGQTDLSIWRSSDGFANRSVMNITEDTYGKGHLMADTLTINSRSCVNQVWHESGTPFEHASYDIRLATYCSDEPPVNDIVGPITRFPTTIPTTFNTISSDSLRVVAQITDVHTGYNNITAAELVITDTTVNDSLSIDWTNAWAMNLTGIDRSPTEASWLWANETALTWPSNSCFRFWIRGEDNKGNWGTDAYVDVCTVTIAVTPYPSEMKTAKLTGPGYSDVTLTWSKSLDDGGGRNVVTKYKVSRSENIRGPFTVIANVTANGAPEYSWSDFGAGHGDYRQFFYLIIANSTFRDSSPSKLAGKFYRTMDGGHQLVSFPLIQANNDPMVVFQTFNYVYARTYVAGESSPWWSHKAGRVINTLTELSHVQGYWIEMGGPGTMTVAGLVPENIKINLKSGWNLIAFPSFNKSYTFSDLDTALGGLLQAVEIFDSSATHYNLGRVQRVAWSTTYLDSGCAYMVRMSADVTWTVPII